MVKVMPSEPTNPRQFTLPTALAAFVVVGLGCAMWRWFGIHGPLVVLDILVGFISWANMTQTTPCNRIWIPTLTVVEIIVWVLVCLTLHALLLPAVHV